MRKHRFIFERIVTTYANCEEHERTCVYCSFTRVTVILREPFRAEVEWYDPNGQAWTGEGDPVCVPDMVAA